MDAMRKRKGFFRRILVLSLLLLALGLAGCSGRNDQEISEQYDYAGDLKGNLAHGTGTLHEDGVLSYEGEFKDGLVNGQGKLYENSILKYEGEFRNGNMLGAGILYNQKGGKLFEGTITENDGETYKGVGTLFQEEGEPAYEGEITVKGGNVELASKGKILYPTGEVFYNGELKDGMPAGEGTYYDTEGKILENN